jgi:hypothetical protein
MVLHIRHFQFPNKEKRDPGVPFEFKSNAISAGKAEQNLCHYFGYLLRFVIRNRSAIVVSSVDNRIIVF